MYMYNFDYFGSSPKMLMKYVYFFSAYAIRQGGDIKAKDILKYIKKFPNLLLAAIGLDEGLVRLSRQAIIYIGADPEICKSGGGGD